MRTPWGDSEGLRERMLPPGRGTPREEVRRNQRERLMGAMVASCAERGYEATRVEDLVTISGVSRRAFYEHFGDKLDCYLATQEEILAAAVAMTAVALRRGGSWRARAERALNSFVETLAYQPAAGRLVLVEAPAAGPRAVERVDETMAGFEALARQAFAEMPEGRDMPEEMVRAMIGGMRKTIDTRLRRGTERELVEMAPQLFELGISYRPPAAPLRRPRRRRRAAPATAPAHSEDPVERLLAATASAVARRGYQEATVEEIVAGAGASLSTFYANFDGKAEALDAALYSGRARMLGEALPAYARARSWPEAIRAGIEGCLAYLEGAPDFARLIAMEVNGASPEALERRDLAIDAVRRFIARGAPQASPLVLETIVNTVYALFCERVRSAGAERLRDIAPMATYLALSPLIGAERACEVANGGKRPAPTGRP
jgi:AcrR family transcriptional regulator